MFCILKKCLCSYWDSKYQAVAELVLRVVVALFIVVQHGVGKLLSFPLKMDFFPDPLGIGSVLSLSLAVFGEFFCGILLMVGLFTRFAAFNLLAVMLTAGLIFHYADPFPKKELALLYGVCFFYFLLAGGNRYSLDRVLFKKTS